MARKKIKKSKPSNNTRKLLILTLLANSCIEASERGETITGPKMRAVLKNTMNMATVLHPEEELDKLYFFVKEVVEAKQDEEYISSEQALVLSLLSIDAHKMRSFFGVEMFDPGDAIKISASDVAIWMKFLDKVDAYCNTKVFVSKIPTPKLPPKEKKKKEKKVRDKPSRSKANQPTTSSSKTKYAKKRNQAKLKIKTMAFKIKAEALADEIGAYIEFNSSEHKAGFMSQTYKNALLDIEYTISFNIEDIKSTYSWKLMTKKRKALITEGLKELSEDISLLTDKEEKS